MQIELPNILDTIREQERQRAFDEFLEHLFSAAGSGQWSTVTTSAIRAQARETRNYLR